MRIVTLARKPLEGTVAENVVADGAGAINVDGCRVGDGGHLRWSASRGMGSTQSFGDDAWTQSQNEAVRSDLEKAQHVGDKRGKSTVGRWPSNVILWGDEPVAALSDASCYFKQV